MRALATKHGNDFTVLVGYAHVVDAVAALQGLLDAFAGQHIAQVGRFEKFNAGAGRYRAFVVAVAGKCKGGIGQREDESAVANLVTIELLLPHRHAHCGAARRARDQHHLHQLARGAVGGKHGLPDALCGCFSGGRVRR